MDKSDTQTNQVEQNGKQDTESVEFDCEHFVDRVLEEHLAVNYCSLSGKKSLASKGAGDPLQESGTKDKVSARTLSI